MDDIEGTVLGNRHVVSNHFLVRISLAKPIEACRPGQFVMMRLPSEEVFLRRPFSIYDLHGRTISMLYRVRGKGTAVMSGMTRGTKVMVLGPLGRPFTVEEGCRPLVVAGGIGIAGVNLLWKSVRKKGLLFFGCAKGEETALLAGDADSGSPSVYIATEDGSRGYRGMVTDLVARHVDDVGGRCQVFACGPEVMYRELKRILENRGIACQILAEERMACGLGLCFGCVKKTIDEKEPYKRACVEGPVFNLWQISL